MSFYVVVWVYISCFCFLNFSKIDTTWTRSGASVSLLLYVIILFICFSFAIFMDDLIYVNFFFFFFGFLGIKKKNTFGGKPFYIDINTHALSCKTTLNLLLFFCLSCNLAT